MRERFNFAQATARGRDLCAARGARLICRAMRHMRCKHSRSVRGAARLGHDELHCPHEANS